MFASFPPLLRSWLPVSLLLLALAGSWTNSLQATRAITLAAGHDGAPGPVITLPSVPPSICAAGDAAMWPDTAADVAATDDAEPSADAAPDDMISPSDRAWSWSWFLVGSAHEEALPRLGSTRAVFSPPR